MWDKIVSAFTGMAGSVFGQKSNAPPGQNTGLTDGAGGSPPVRTFWGDVKDDVGRIARGAMFAPIEGMVNGRAQRAFNKHAFPGTLPYEQMNAGSNHAPTWGDASAGDRDNRQRERESERSASSSLASQRMSASASLASELIRNQGDTKLIALLLRQGGILPPHAAIDTKMLATGRVEAEVDRIRAETDRTRTDTQWMPEKAQSEIYNRDVDTSLKSSQKDAVDLDTALKPLEFALKEWQAKYGQSYSLREVSGWLAAVREANQGKSGMGLTQSLIDIMLRNGVPEGDVYMLRKKLRL